MTASTMTRAARRRLKREAKALSARWISGGLFETIEDGGALRVQGKAALGAAREAAERLLRQGGGVRCEELPDAAAIGFPGLATAVRPPGARAYIALGIDRDGRLSFATQWATTWCADGSEPGRAERERIAMAALWPRLRPLLDYRGIVDPARFCTAGRA
jgi:hypothetical protein